MEDRTEFVVTLRPVPNWHTSGVQRLRIGLKCLLRGFGLRAVRVTPVKREGLLERFDREQREAARR